MSCGMERLDVVGLSLRTRIDVVGILRPVMSRCSEKGLVLDTISNDVLL